MSLQWTTLDVFTEHKYRGNPVALIHVPSSTPLNQTQKQLIAREFNLSESVFLHEQTETDKVSGDVRIDIFTPIAEVPFAGHPTVGTSNYLLRQLSEPSKAYTAVRALQAKAGRIPIQLSPDHQGISLQVSHDVHIHNANPFNFTIQPSSDYPVVSIVKGMTFILAKLDTLADLANQTQNLLGAENTYKVSHLLDSGWQQGLVTSYFYVDLGFDDAETRTRTIRTRGLGSREDPATGSAASALSSYLSLTEDGPPIRKFVIVQGVEMGRESQIYIQVTLDYNNSDKKEKSIKEVLLSGTAVKVMEGTLEIPHP